MEVFVEQPLASPGSAKHSSLALMQVHEVHECPRIKTLQIRKFKHLPGNLNQIRGQGHLPSFINWTCCMCTVQWSFINYWNIGERLFKGEGWKYHIKYIGQDSFISCLNMQQTYRCHLIVIASWQAYKATTVSRHPYICCILKKEVKQPCPLYLIWHFQPPSYKQLYPAPLLCNTGYRLSVFSRRHSISLSTPSIVSTIRQTRGSWAKSPTVAP